MAFHCIALHYMTLHNMIFIVLKCYIMFISYAQWQSIPVLLIAHLQAWACATVVRKVQVQVVDGQNALAHRLKSPLLSLSIILFQRRLAEKGRKVASHPNGTTISQNTI